MTSLCLPAKAYLFVLNDIRHYFEQLDCKYCRSTVKHVQMLRHVHLGRFVYARADAPTMNMANLV